MTTNRHWGLTDDDLNSFDLSETGARAGVWRDQAALYMDGFHTIPVLLNEKWDAQCFRLRAEIAFPGENGFAGLVFGARDSQNYELVYISPGGSDSEPGHIQYDPIMNGSSTWQIYNGPAYQAYAPVPQGEWVTLTLEVRSDQVAITVGEGQVPQLTVSSLQHGKAIGKIGVWGNLPCYIRNLSAAELPLEPSFEKHADTRESDLRRLAEEGFVPEWMVSSPVVMDEPVETWSKVFIEENGTLNFNRLYPAEAKGVSIQAVCMFRLPEELTSVLTFGFSDQIRIWANDEKVYQGEWKWAPPESDGRIRPNHASVTVRWKSGLNSIRAVVTNQECMFGWGLSLKTGFPNL